MAPVGPEMVRRQTVKGEVGRGDGLPVALANGSRCVAADLEAGALGTYVKTQPCRVKGPATPVATRRGRWWSDGALE